MRGFIGSLKSGKTCLRKLREMAVQLVEQHVKHFGCAVLFIRGSLKRGAVFNVFGNKKIDANANRSMGLIVVAHGFNQDAAQFIHADNQVV